MFALALLIAAATPAASACAYDHSILSLGIDAFDQDMTGGWRVLEATPGCTAKAADVLRY
ncbi:MAG: hypothetical protein ACRYG4_02805 [Janthinobacterium lividum]